jgi:hypothetical protein
MRVRMLWFGTLLCLGTNLAAEQPVCRPSESKITSVDVVRIQGEEHKDGTMTLTITPGTPATRAVRVYSEPSHTLLAVMEDSKYASTEEGRQWRSQTIAEQQPRSGILTRLPGGPVQLHLDGRPVLDDRVAVWVNGNWPGVSPEERLVADAVVGHGDFGFSIAVPLLNSGDTFGGPTKEWEHCCIGASCFWGGGQVCRTCNTPYFTCCTLGICCSIDCYWVAACTCADGCC